jgi:predicted CxxxxCH...CXXCH cytochrome family protein
MGRRFALLAALAAGVAFLCLYSGARAGVVGSPHDFSTTSLLSDYQTTPLTSSGVCSICHIPHNAADNVLWPRSLDSYRNALGMDGDDESPTGLPDYRKIVTMQCYDCHDAHVTTVKVNDLPAFTDFATDHKPQNIAFGFTTPTTGKDSGSTMKEDEPGGSGSGFYENSPPFQTTPQTYYGADSRTTSPFKRDVMDNATLAKTGGHYFKSVDPTPGTVYKGDKLPCSDCHDPHAWDSTNLDWQAFFRPKEIYASGRWTTVFGSSRPRASTFMANDITDLLGVSTDRSDSESRKLCALCHGYSDLWGSVTFNEINSDYTSTANIITPPLTVDEHGQGSNVACVSCHDHESIDAACNDCHSYPGLDNTNSPHQLGATHEKHVGNPTGFANSRKFYCKICHFGYSPNHNQSGYSAGESWALDNSWRANVNIDFDNAWNPESIPYSGDPPICAGLYCHGDAGVFAGAGRNTGANTKPGWDNAASGACGACHGTGTQMNSLNHPAHLSAVYGPVIDNTTCANGNACHTAYGLSPTATHVDNTLSFNNSADNTFANTLVCENCHSIAVVDFIDNGAANTFSGDNLARTNWNDNNYKLPCLTCHNKTTGEQAKPNIDGSGNFAPNIEAHWLVTGHGAETAIDCAATTTETPGADPPVWQTVPVPCGMCHDIASSHFASTGNPWRLRTSTFFDNATTGAFDEWCHLKCHANAPPAEHTYNVAQGGTFSTKDDWDTHGTSAPAVDTGITDIPPATMPLEPFLTNKGYNQAGATGSELFLCITCHDPHGIGNVAAVPRTFNGVIDNDAIGNDNVNMLRHEYTMGTGSILCKKCHI